MAGRIFILSVVALCVLFFLDRDQQPLVHPPGVLVAEKPVQVDLQPSLFTFDDYQLTRRARFEMRARVLSIEPYYMKRESDLSPLDLALGWGVMSDQAVLDQIDISQGGRWYHTRYQLPSPAPEQQISASSSNMHMIPATRSIARQLKNLRVGDVIKLAGLLVDADHESGWFWRTSMSRTDTGAGACEIVFVEALSVE
jgi:hypothetical protein